MNRGGCLATYFLMDSQIPGCRKHLGTPKTFDLLLCWLVNKGMLREGISSGKALPTGGTLMACFASMLGHMNFQLFLRSKLLQTLGAGMGI